MTSAQLARAEQVGEEEDGAGQGSSNSRSGGRRRDAGGTTALDLTRVDALQVGLQWAG